MFPTQPSPMVAPQLNRFLAGQPLCVAGRVNLLRFVRAPGAGEVVGSVTTPTGSVIPITRSRLAPLGGRALAQAEGQLSTICGVLCVTPTGQLGLNVTQVVPGVNPFLLGGNPACALLPLLFSPDSR